MKHCVSNKDGTFSDSLIGTCIYCSVAIIVGTLYDRSLWLPG